MRNEPRSSSRRYNGLSVENITEEYASRAISGGLPVTKMKSRRIAIGGNKLFKIIAVICMVHASRQFALLNRYNDEDLQARMLRSSTRAQHQLDQTKRKRRRWTAPLPTKEGPNISFLSQISPLDDVIGMDSTYPSFPTTDYVVGDHICGHQKNTYNTNDRIIIYGIFSHPVAAELALTLAERCGVRHILGLSDHLLDTEKSLRLEFLLQRIPSLQLEFEKGSLGDRATYELFKSFSPSHVFYFQSESFKISSSGDDDEESAFLTHSGIDQLEQICNAIVKIGSKLKERETATRLLYVTSNLAETTASDKNNLPATIISKSNQILLDVYRIHYQVDVREINLPSILGPFKEGALWLLSDEFIRLANEMADHDQIQYYDNASSNATTSASFNMTQPIIYISDAIRSILVSGKLGHIPDYESIPILGVAKSQTTTLLNISKTLHPLFKNSSFPNSKNETLNTSFLPILSWNYKTAMPYRDPPKFTTSSIENDKIATVALTNTRHHLDQDEKIDYATYSQLERRQNNLFPCVSVCGSFVKCRSSIWDPIVPIARKATKRCQFLLIAADFSPTLEKLPIIRESTNNITWPRDSICQLAFVSSNSIIVANAIQEEVKNKGDEASKDNTDEEWNGQVSSNGWILVWIDKDEESITQADSLIPKITPEDILHPSVEFVFYIEPHHFHLLPTLQIMWFLMNKQLSTKAKAKPDKNNVWLFPESHIAFFAHTYNESKVEHLDPSKPDFISKAAKFILEQNSKNSVFQGDASLEFNTTRQSKAYTNSLIWQKEKGLKFELIDTFLMIYPIDNVRGRQLRCEWYEEQLFWSNEDNRNLEGLSLSYVLHRWRRRGRLLRNPFDSKWGEMMLLQDNGQEISPSDVKFKKIELKEKEKEREYDDPQHYVNIHDSLLVRKFYSYE